MTFLYDVQLSYVYSMWDIDSHLRGKLLGYPSMNLCSMLSKNRKVKLKFDIIGYDIQQRLSNYNQRKFILMRMGKI